MYKLYVNVENKMLPIGSKDEIAVFQEDQLEILEEQQQKSYSVGNIMWLIYIKQK